MRTFVLGGLASALLLTSPTVARAQDGADPSAAQGRWGVEFIGVLGQTRGGSALRFTSPTAAWRLSARVTTSNADFPGITYSNHDYIFELGRRWYTRRESRVQPFTGLGVIGGHSWSEVSAGGTSETGYLGAYGELGAQIFITDEIALGSRWKAEVVYDEANYSTTSWEHIHVVAGGIDVFAMFRF
jgi:hypothetical protein